MKNPEQLQKIKDQNLKRAQKLMTFKGSVLPGDSIFAEVFPEVKDRKDILQFDGIRGFDRRFLLFVHAALCHMTLSVRDEKLVDIAEVIAKADLMTLVAWEKVAKGTESTMSLHLSLANCSPGRLHGSIEDYKVKMSRLGASPHYRIDTALGVAVKKWLKICKDREIHAAKRKEGIRRRAEAQTLFDKEKKSESPT